MVFGQAGAHIGVVGGDPLPQSAAGDVAFRPGQRCRVHFHRVDSGAGHLLGDGDRDRARPGAQVHDQGIGDVHGPQGVDRPGDHHLGLGTGDENAGAYFQLEIAEVGAAGDVLQGFPCRPAGYTLPVAGVEVAVRDRVQLSSTDAVHERREFLGVRPGRGNPGFREPKRRPRDLVEQEVHC